MRLNRSILYARRDGAYSAYRMFWAQACLSFVLWIAYGVVLARKSATLRSQLRTMPRGRRVALGALCLIGSFLVIFLVLGAVLALGGFKEGTLSIPVWIVVTIGGVGFVHVQTLGTAMLVTVAQEPVTTPDAQTSTSKEHSDSGAL